ncbi:MAG TPA: helix-turn-helix transcriptional regulator [Polyangium sp.]|uniref:XRE family transcriptional regulator n=2 Tax=Polyangium TaxID=55 RepID=A0A4U1JCN6_9BACT|nr:MULTISPECIES: helix-turn-helix transcriptional regulator [Polyangium]MDI1431270.1 helix-turn-helix transcriptional regulator [Polyangium sorediatum]TKD08372.1 XRE family transcriptional regulator [Polyangium fumosum]HVK70897.1 helix-turn-helix transcriptional regulator [Polyangium sp.]
MTPDDLKALRKELDCTAKELAAALGLEQETVLAWERGDLFPTKRFVTKMEELRSKGKGAIVRKPRRGAVAASPMAVLADPETWKLVRKLVAHAELRREVGKLAEAYPDPAEESGST